MAGSAAVPATDTSGRGTDRPSPSIRRRRAREALIGGVITRVALTGIAAVVLIFVFVAREALPLLTDPAMREEVTFGKLFQAQVYRAGRAAAFTWQPVGSVPKYSMIPLFVGTLKVTFVAMAIAVPVGIAAAVYVADHDGNGLYDAFTVDLTAAAPWTPAQLNPAITGSVWDLALSPDGSRVIYRADNPNLGRIELFTFLVLFTRTFWRK